MASLSKKGSASFQNNVSYNPGFYTEDTTSETEVGYFDTQGMPIPTPVVTVLRTDAKKAKKQSKAKPKKRRKMLFAKPFNQIENPMGKYVRRASVPHLGNPKLSKKDLDQRQLQEGESDQLSLSMLGAISPSGLASITLRDDTTSTLQLWSDGPFGLIDFTASLNQALYLTLRAGDVDGTYSLERLTAMLISKLGLEPPRLILSVVGTVGDKDVSTETAKLLKNGLSEMTDTWIVTNGVNTGAVKAIAHAAAQLRVERKDGNGVLPVMAFVDYDTAANNCSEIYGPNGTAGGTRGDNPFESRAKRVHYDSVSKHDLEPTHTHFFFVRDQPDDGNDGTRECDRLRIKFVESFRPSNVDTHENQEEQHLYRAPTMSGVFSSGTSFPQLKRYANEYRQRHENYRDTVEMNANAKNKRHRPSSRVDIAESEASDKDAFLAHGEQIATVELICGGKLDMRRGNQFLLQMAELSVQNHKYLGALVIIDGTGGLGSVLGYAHRLLHDTTPASLNLTHEALDTMLREEFSVVDDLSAQDMLTRVFDVVGVATKVTLFDWAHSHVDDLDETFLRSFNKTLVMPVLRGLNKDVVHKYHAACYMRHMDMLRFAVAFDRVNESKRYLTLAKIEWDIIKTGPPTTRQGVPVNFDVDTQYALEYALVDNKHGLVQVLVPYIKDIPRFLYGCFGRDEDLVHGARGRVQDGFGGTIARLYKFGVKEPQMLYLRHLMPGFVVDEEVQRLTPLKDTQQLTPYGVHPGNAIDYSFIQRGRQLRNNKAMRHAWSLILQLVHGNAALQADEDTDPRFDGKERNYPKSWVGDGDVDVFYDRTLESVWELVKRYRDQTAADNDELKPDLLACQELMLWAILMNRKELAQYFWQLGGNAIPNALLVSKVAFSLSHREELKNGKFDDIKTEFRKISQEYEKLAIGVVRKCWDEDTAMTRSVLIAPLTSYAWLRDANGSFFSCMKLAYIAKNDNFIKLPSCQAVVWDRWIGMKTNREKEMNYKAWWEFDASPRLKFRLDFAAFIIFILLFSYVALENMTRGISNAEYILLIWVVLMAFEEIRQMGENGMGWAGLKEWFASISNKIDILMYALFTAIYVLRFGETDSGTGSMRVAKFLYGLNTIVVYCRLLSYIRISKSLGPKLIIFGELFKDLVTFLTIMAVFCVSFGIFLQTLTNPFVPFTKKTIFRVIYRPFFQVFGELMLDDIALETSCGTQDPFQDCAFETDVAVPIVTAAYLVITSIMLLNMLIADFSSTYEEYARDADKLYKFSLLQFVEEYQDRTIIPVPFNFPVVVAAFIYNIGKAIMLAVDSSRPIVAMLNYDIEVENFQDRIADSHLEEQDEKESVSDSLGTVRKILRIVAKDVESLKGRTYASSIAHEILQDQKLMQKDEQSQTLGKSITSVEARSSEAYGFGENQEYPIVLRLHRRDATYEDSIKQTIARKAHSVEFGDKYQHVQARCRKIAQSLEQTGNAIGSNPFSRLQPLFVKWENRYSEFRFPKKDENKLKLQVVTRWKRDDSGVRIERSGLPLLEFAAIKLNKHQRQWGIPELPVDDVTTPIAAHVFNNMTIAAEASRVQGEFILNWVTQHFSDLTCATRIYEGFIDDERNCDDSWSTIEVDWFMERNANYRKLDTFDLSQSHGRSDGLEVSWVTVHRDLDLRSEQEDLLLWIASAVEAYW